MFLFKKAFNVIPVPYLFFLCVQLIKSNDFVFPTPLEKLLWPLMHAYVRVVCMRTTHICGTKTEKEHVALRGFGLDHCKVKSVHACGEILAPASHCYGQKR